MLQLFDEELLCTLDGGHDAAGSEARPLDERRARDFVAARAGRVSAFAISGLFGVRNPAHEQRLRDIVHAETDLPVTCGLV